MLERIRKFFRGEGAGFPAPSKRNLEAAGGGRRWANAPVSRDAKSYIQAGAGTVAARAQHYVLNTAPGARIAEALPGAIVGTGIMPRNQHPSETIRGRLMRDWLTLGDMIDADGMADIYGLQALATRDMVVIGEALFHIGSDPNGAPQTRRLDPRQLDSAKTMRLSDGGSIVAGVEFAPTGRRRAYWIFPSAPGDPISMMALTSERFPASDIIHMFRPLVPGQVRGLSWLAPILLTARELDTLWDALIVKTKVSALFVGSIQDIDGTGAGMEGTQTGSTLDLNIEPGGVRVEAPGKKLEWSEPPTAGDGPALAKDSLRLIASGCGMTYENLSGDFSQVNYSSARAAQLEFRKFVEGVQHNTLVFQFCRPIWQRFIRYELLRGAISATAFQADRSAFEAVKWLPPAWQSVDPEKDANAAETMLRNRLTSRSAIVAEQGLDIESLDAEIAADQARAKKLGIEPIVEISTIAPKENNAA